MLSASSQHHIYLQIKIKDKKNAVEPVISQDVNSTDNS